MGKVFTTTAFVAFERKICLKHLEPRIHERIVEVMFENTRDFAAYFEDKFGIEINMTDMAIICGNVFLLEYLWGQHGMRASDIGMHFATDNDEMMYWLETHNELPAAVTELPPELLDWMKQWGGRLRHPWNFHTIHIP